MALILLLLGGSPVSSPSRAADSLLLLLLLRGSRGRSVSHCRLLAWGACGFGLLGLLMRLLRDWLWLCSWGLCSSVALHASCKCKGVGERV